MFTARSIARTFTALSIATSAVAVATPAAHAATGVATVTFTKCTNSPTDAEARQLNRCITGTMTVRAVQGTGNVRYVEFQCAAVAVGDGAAVTMDECSFGGISAVDVPHTAPGAANTQVGISVVTAGSGATACIGATASWLLSTATLSDSACRGMTLNLA